MLSESEFEAGFVAPGLYDEDEFENWDTDGDGSLGEDEVGEGLHEEWDMDDSGTLDDDEWDAAMDEVDDAGWSEM